MLLAGQQEWRLAYKILFHKPSALNVALLVDVNHGGQGGEVPQNLEWGH